MVVSVGFLGSVTCRGTRGEAARRIVRRERGSESFSLSLLTILPAGFAVSPHSAPRTPRKIACYAG